MKLIGKVVLLVVSIILIVCTVILNQSSLFFSNFLQTDTTNNLKSDVFIQMISSENHYLVKSREEKQDHSILANTIQLATNINFKNVKSLIYDEIPGLFTMTSNVITPGDNLDFTNMPIESAPPIEELMREREVNEDSLDYIDDKKGTPTPSPSELDKNTVFIYHSHSRESFIPHLKDTKSASTAQHKDINITLVGERFGERLRELGIGSVVDTTDTAEILYERGLKYGKSYEISREVVKEAMAGNEDYTYFLDIHRDGRKRNSTTTTIDGKSYAKLFFIVGVDHPNSNKNMKFATELDNLIKEKYPNLTDGVRGKDKSQGNGVYNQDLSPNSVIIEIGGHENTLEEMYNTAELLAELFAEFYWKDAVEVNR